ncbi:MAG TPA: DUF1569 domain-containing protein [Ignavibacteria bacterium]|jgi:hypothetical protein
MKSLFDTSVNLEIIGRINKLTSGSKAEWGKMTVSQMLSHCRVPLESAFGEVKLKRNPIGVLLGPIAKKSIFKDEPFKKNLPTDKNFIFKDDRNFDEEKIKLTEKVQKFAASGPDGITKDPHPFFGKLTVNQWDMLMWKHLDHHLRQFGV